MSAAAFPNRAGSRRLESMPNVSRPVNPERRVAIVPGRVKCSWNEEHSKVEALKLEAISSELHCFHFHVVMKMKLRNISRERVCGVVHRTGVTGLEIARKLHDIAVCPGTCGSSP